MGRWSTLLDEEWLRLLQEVYLCARGERIQELRGRSARRFDAQGLHPFSFVLGRVAMLEDMLDLPGEVRANPAAIKNAATQDAQDKIVEEIREHGHEAFR